MPRGKISRAPSALPPSQMSFLDALLVFVKWSQGRSDLTSTLQCLAQYAGAEAVSLSRWEKSKKTTRVAGVSDDMSDPLSPRLHKSFAPVIFGDYIDSVKPGSTVLMSDALDNRSVSDPELERWIFKRGIADIAIICVGAENGMRDILEFHFARNVPKRWLEEQEVASAKLHDVFQGRQRGLMIQCLLRNANSQRKATNPTENTTLMAADNPAGLTRSEWRVCALIANGLSRDGVAQELAVKPGTLRTHLRNIYSKTGYERFHELALRLVSPQERSHIGMVNQDQAA